MINELKNTNSIDLAGIIIFSKIIYINYLVVYKILILLYTWS